MVKPRSFACRHGKVGNIGEKTRCDVVSRVVVVAIFRCGKAHAANIVVPLKIVIQHIDELRQSELLLVVNERFDGRQAVKSAFALLSQKVTKARRLRGGKE